MANHLRFKESSLQLILSLEEFDILRELIRETCSEFPDIDGVLLTGSLVQRLCLPPPPKENDLGSFAKAYADVVGRTRRKLFPHLDSDLDFWILTEEQEGNAQTQEITCDLAYDLLEWYSKQKKVDLAEWIYRKKQAFGKYYKKNYLYSARWIKENPKPYNASGFKEKLEEKVCKLLPEAVKKINYYFRKKIPGDFLETRCFPPSVFNLKTERISIQDYEDRTPFPFYIRDWVDIERNCLIMYSSEKPNLIYPFNSEGVVPGENLAKKIGWTSRHVDFVLYKEGSKIKSDPFVRL